VIIIYENEYNSKVHDFITTTISYKLLTTSQRNYNATSGQPSTTVKRSSPKKVSGINISPNPTTPRMRGLIKIHKTEFPIRPVVDWKNAPTYKLAKKLVEVLQKYTSLPYTLNVKNTTQLINDLTDIPYDHNLRLASFDITNMYTNIHTNELLDIINSVCDNNYIEGNLKHDILKLSKIIMDQNYFNFEDKTYLKHEALAMEPPHHSSFQSSTFNF
jgi:hypothetical protein